MVAGIGIAPALLVGDTIRTGVASDSLAHLGDAALVVLRDRQDPRRHHVHQAAVLRRLLADTSAELTLHDALGLGERAAAATIDIADRPLLLDELAPSTVVLRGDHLIGVAMAGDADRGWSGATVGSGVLDFENQPVGAEWPASVPAGSRRRFRAFADVTSPAEVVAGMPFEVHIGFALRGEPGEPPILIPDAPPELTFEVQVDGFGFEFPDGVSRRLIVRRDEPSKARATVSVIAQEVEVTMARSLEVTYSYGGGPVGHGWCDPVVHPSDVQDVPPPEEQPRAESSGSSFGPPRLPADLTVTISPEPGSALVHWMFQSPHDVGRPTDQVIKALDSATAQTFALGLMARMPTERNSVGLAKLIEGVGVPVTQAMPEEFWHVLADVWRAVRDSDEPNRVPTLLLITDEPSIPWELAYVDPGATVPAELVPDVPLRMLGALWSVGRWVKPVRQPFADPRPPVPPESEIVAREMVVVKGDYTDAKGIALLDEAVAEADTLAEAYSATLLGIDWPSMMSLIDDAVADASGAPVRPGVVHVAAHGQVGAGAQQKSGILLKDKTLLQPEHLTTSQLGRGSRPFVFLNACQVGTASKVLNSYSGMVGSLVESGCRGVLAPLWNVDDDVAHRLSLEFYATVFGHGTGGGETVGEAVRQLRATFTSEGATSATPLAYVFYGNPHLRLTRPGRIDPDTDN